MGHGGSVSWVRTENQSIMAIRSLKSIMYYVCFPNDSFATGKNKETIPMKTLRHHPDKILEVGTSLIVYMALRAKRKVRREQCEDNKVLSSSFDL